MTKLPPDPKPFEYTKGAYIKVRIGNDGALIYIQEQDGKYVSIILPPHKRDELIKYLQGEPAMSLMSKPRGVGMQKKTLTNRGKCGKVVV